MATYVETITISFFTALGFSMGNKVIAILEKHLWVKVKKRLKKVIGAARRRCQRFLHNSCYRNRKEDSV